MPIEQLAAWGEFVGGVAVVAGLIFVALQLRVSNREARIAVAPRHAITGRVLLTGSGVSGVITRFNTMQYRSDTRGFRRHGKQW